MAHEALKERQSVMWGNGPFDKIAESLNDMHARVAETLAVGADDAALDLGCGTGRVAELLAARGATVTGIDLAPALIETAKERAAARGLAIDYRVGDCENLTGIDDETFDAVGSAVGIMFAPDHEAAAAELARVTKPGGRLALANWIPGPGVQDIFKVMAPFQPAPPPSVPFDWGDESRVTELLGDAFELAFAPQVNTVTYESGEDYWQDFSQNYGPTRSLYESLGDRGEELHRAWVELFGSDQVEHRRPYLLVTGKRVTGRRVTGSDS
jgi:ubiquinone/menaquinone biosynthesis C-methylase UbiE